MNHSFNVDMAIRYGVDVSIFINHISYWVKFNKNEDLNYNGDRYWTYNKIMSFTKHFPYWSHKQIERIINKCVSEGLLIRSNFNKLKYDRTCWYSLTDLCSNMLDLDISRNRENIIPKSGDENPEIGTPIPNNKTTDNKTHIKIKDKAQPKKQVAVVSPPEWLDKSLWEEFSQHRKEMKKPMTPLAQQKMINKLDQMRSNGQDVTAVLENSIANGWQGIFEIKQPKENQYGNQQSKLKSVSEIVWERITSGLPEFENYRSGQEVLPF